MLPHKHRAGITGDPENLGQRVSSTIVKKRNGNGYYDNGNLDLTAVNQIQPKDLDLGLGSSWKEAGLEER